MNEPLRVGAVAYHPRVVTIWEDFRRYFAAAGAPVDYVLYPTYDRLVEAFLREELEIAWATNTAYVAIDDALDGEAQLLGMRDVDRAYHAVLATRKDTPLTDVSALAGRPLAVGSSDCAHASILPLHFLRAEGLDAEEDCELLRFDRDLGKHGDTGGSELDVLRADAAGEADAGAHADVTWALFRGQGVPETAQLELSWRSPGFYHCVFVARPELEATRWSDALLAMSFDDAETRPAMELEGVRRWLPGDSSGYSELRSALQRTAR